jgi:hypothetical protein
MILEGTIGFCELNLKFAGETINVSSKSKSIQIVLFVASYLSLKVMLGNLSDDRIFHEKTIYALHILILMLVFIILLTKERLFLSFYL